MSKESSRANTKYVGGSVLMLGILGVILILQEHYIAGGAAVLAALIYASRARVKQTGDREE